MTDRLRLEDIDWTTVVLYLILVIFGWLNLFAVSYNEQSASLFDLGRNYGIQLLWILVSFVVIIFLFAIDHRSFHYFAYPIYAFAVVMLLAVLVFGTEVNNSKSWIRLFGFNLQPSEFAKLGVVIAVARYLSGYNVKLWTWRSVLILSAIVGLPALLIAAQPDWGTAMVYGSLLLLLYREGMPGWILAIIVFFAGLFLITLWMPQIQVIFVLISMAFIGFAVFHKKVKNILTGAVIFLALYFAIRITFNMLDMTVEPYKIMLGTIIVSSIVYLVLSFKYKIKAAFLILALLFGSIAFTYTVDYVFHNILKPHQQTRVNILLGKETDVTNVGYNLNQSKIAIGSGGFFGKGFLKGTQTKLNFVPEQSTDFIFCTIGEEWGFVGTTVVIILFSALLIRLLFLAERQKSNFSRIYGYGILSILFFHFGINIAMTIGLFPVVGIPLPFFSYGGSSMLAFTLMLFIFIRLDSMRKVYVK